jgi:hypothetical protein
MPMAIKAKKSFFKPTRKTQDERASNTEQGLSVFHYNTFL